MKKPELSYKELFLFELYQDLFNYYEEQYGKDTHNKAYNGILYLFLRHIKQEKRFKDQGFTYPELDEVIINWEDITFEDVVFFISPETKRTASVK